MLHTSASTTTVSVPFPVRQITHAIDQATASWHSDTAAPEVDGSPTSLALLLHRANFDLWHQEDEARNPQATDADIATTKHAIDRINQKRNDTVEALDRSLLSLLQPHGLPAATAPLNSETPGLILDRLSILALKRFHTAEQIARTDVEPIHQLRNRDRLATLEEQSEDLTACLESLWAEVLSGTRRFKLYRQLKMYNDPSLNPAIYRSAAQK